MTKWCANYDREWGCLPLECECYMLGKCWTGAVLPLLPEAVLPLTRCWRKPRTGGARSRPSALLHGGRPFLPDNLAALLLPSLRQGATADSSGST
ncbi:MAG: cysteine-rich VLP protein [Oscillospiraceae bacterium]